MSEPAPATDHPLSFLSRRRFLKVALAGGGVLLGTAGGGLALRGCAPDVDGLRLLDAQAYRTLSRLVEVMFPASALIPVDAQAFDLPRLFDGWLADEPEALQGDLKTALTLVEFGPILFEARLHTFSNLPPAERAAHWQGWGHSRLALRRQVSLGLRKFFNLVFFDRPEVWPHIGYPGPSLGVVSP